MRECKESNFPEYIGGYCGQGDLEVELKEDLCKGYLVSTECVSLLNGIPEMDIKEGDSLTEAIVKIVVSYKKMERDNTFYKESIDKIMNHLDI